VCLDFQLDIGNERLLQDAKYEAEAVEVQVCHYAFETVWRIIRSTCGSEFLRRLRNGAKGESIVPTPVISCSFGAALIVWGSDP
jgi:hypothetical protein